MAQTVIIASARIPVKPATWEAMHKLRKPGQTFDEMLREQIPAVKILAEQQEAAGTAVPIVPDGTEGAGGD